MFSGGEQDDNHDEHQVVDFASKFVHFTFSEVLWWSLGWIPLFHCVGEGP